MTYRNACDLDTKPVTVAETVPLDSQGAASGNPAVQCASSFRIMLDDSGELPKRDGGANTV
jgi:hypothetical protein